MALLFIKLSNFHGAFVSYKLLALALQSSYILEFILY